MKNNKSESFSVRPKKKIYVQNNKFKNYNDKKTSEKLNRNPQAEMVEEIVEQIEEEYEEIVEKNEDVLENIEDLEEENEQIEDEDRLENIEEENKEIVEENEDTLENLEEEIENNNDIVEEKEDEVTEKIFELIQEEKEENIGTSQVYKSMRVALSPPKDNLIISITKISRDIYIKEVELFEDGAQVTAMLTMNINYGTSKKVNGKEEKSESEDNKDNDKNKKHRDIVDKEEDALPILTDGVVRSTTSIIPCIINVNIPGAKPLDAYEIVGKEIIVVDTKYILDDGSKVDAIPLGKSISEIVETYIISASIKIV